MDHHFDTKEAARYGITEAVIISHMRFWIITNKSKNKNFYDGRTWTYNSVQGYMEIWNYLTAHQIRTAVSSLIDQGVLLKGNFNKNPYDRTSWYAFADEETFLKDYFEANKDKKKPEPTPPGHEMPEMKEKNRDFSENSSFAKAQMETGDHPNTNSETPNSITDINTIKKTFGLGKKAKPSQFFLKKEEEKPSAAPADFGPAAAEAELPAPGMFSMDERQQRFYQDIITYRDEHPKQYPAPFLEEFYLYWTEPNATHTKMKFEAERYFGIHQRLAWFWKQNSNSEKSAYWTEHWQHIEQMKSMYRQQEDARQMNAFKVV